jgi:uncharacterized membrane protein
MHLLVLLAIGIGFVAGLRSLTAPAIVCWGAHLGWINLHGSPLSFMGSTVAVGILTLLAILELVGDKLPQTPARTTAFPLIARLIMGALCGACLYAAGAATPLVGAILGAIGAVIGTFAGYHIRHALVSGLKVKDVLIAIPEDIIAIVLAYVIVRSTLS